MLKAMNQNIYKTFMMFFSVFHLNIMSNLNFGQNQRSWSYKFGQILAEKFQNFKFPNSMLNISIFPLLFNVCGRNKKKLTLASHTKAERLLKIQYFEIPTIMRHWQR